MKEHNSGMPDTAYFESMARAEYAWNHRMEADPLEGFGAGRKNGIKSGSINFDETTGEDPITPVEATTAPVDDYGSYDPKCRMPKGI